MEQVTPWSSVGYLVYKRTYARRLDENAAVSVTEEWPDTVDRVLRACSGELECGFTDEEAIRLRGHLLALRGTVAGRFLWQLGTPTVARLGLASLQNCACVCVDEPVRPFTWTADMLMLGAGVGFNIQREYVYKLPKVRDDFAAPIRNDDAGADFIVPDSREGWVKLLEYTLRAAFEATAKKGFTYSTQLVRGAGAPIRGFGGTASGSEILAEGIANISAVIDKRKGKQLRPIDCLDIMNIIGAIVVAGNVRRSAQIAIGDMDDFQYLRSKRWDLGSIPNWRANSNNSVVCNDFDLLPEEIWKGYMGNGEPFGLINLKLARTVGRTGERSYPDREVIGFNPCLSFDTPLLTTEGYFPIGELVGKEVDIWNGNEWSRVTPFSTGENELVRVHLTDGSHIDCTPYHNFLVIEKFNNDKVERVSAKDLKLGSKLQKWDMPVVDQSGITLPIDYRAAYSQGFYAGDGSRGYCFSFLYRPKYVCADKLIGRIADKEVGGERRTWYHGPMLDKSYVPLDKCLGYRMQWLAGLLDSDGTVSHDENGSGFQICSVDHDFLLRLRLMLSMMGVRAKVVSGSEAGMRPMPDGHGGSKDYYCQQSKRLLIGNQDAYKLVQMGLETVRAVHDGNAPQRDARQYVKVKDIEWLDRVEETFCVTEPKRGQMTVNGIVTGNCAEQSLANYETCCLAEVFLPNVGDKAQLFDVVTLLYRVCKHSLNLPCHNKETEEIVHKNQRMGIGITGYLQATEEQRGWLSDCYTKLREYDKQYSADHGFPVSIKLTTIKPSGTLSLLPGVTSGCHPAYAQYLIRRIRLASDSPLVETIRDAGYRVEPVRQYDGSDDRSTVVAEFPFSYPDGTKLAKDMSAIDQLEIVRKLQAEWSDNAVSCTVYYKKEELPEIKDYLSKHYNKNFKSLSFLLHSEHGFQQAPLEEITQEQYEKLVAKTKLITGVANAEFDSEDECASGVCPVK